MKNNPEKSLKVVVIGGSGLIGGKVVHNLLQKGHEVVAASPSKGVNAVTGEGLGQALAGASVVIDVSNSPSWADQDVLEFFQKSSSNLLAAEVEAGVKHHLALSVVGTDRLQESGYFRAKLAQENLIKKSPVPYTIVRATQFFEFVGGIAQAATEGENVRLPSAMMQPIAAEDVATLLVEAALEKPLQGIVDIAGPDRIRQDELLRRFLKAKNDGRQVLTDEAALYFGIKLDDQSLTPDSTPRLGSTHFADWLSRQQS